MNYHSALVFALSAGFKCALQNANLISFNFIFFRASLFFLHCCLLRSGSFVFAVSLFSSIKWIPFKGGSSFNMLEFSMKGGNSCQIVRDKLNAKSCSLRNSKHLIAR